MDRGTWAALIIAGASVATSAWFHFTPLGTVRYACALLFPLAVIAWPAAFESAYRRDRSGPSTGGEGPVPAGMVRVVAWLLLLTMIAARHVAIYHGVQQRL